MAIKITTEKDIERLRLVAELQARELEALRKQLAFSAQKLAAKDGLDPQAVLEMMMNGTSNAVNTKGSEPAYLRVRNVVPPIITPRTIGQKTRRPVMGPPTSPTSRPRRCFSNSMRRIRFARTAVIR